MVCITWVGKKGVCTERGCGVHCLCWEKGVVHGERLWCALPGYGEMGSVRREVVVYIAWVGRRGSARREVVACIACVWREG